MSSSTIVEALDKISGQATPSSSTIVEAIDRLANRFDPFSAISDLAVGPNEKMIILAVEGVRKLHGQNPPPPHVLWYYNFDGTLTDLTGAFPGVGKVQSVLSWFHDEVGPIVFNFPDPSLGGPPYDAPPPGGYAGVQTNADTLGRTKTIFEFPDGSTLVSFGVNQTKLVPHQDGTAHLFETNLEVIVTGTGKFAGARGLITSDLGGYFNPLNNLDPTLEPYKSGYPVKILVVIRVIT